MRQMNRPPALGPSLLECLEPRRLFDSAFANINVSRLGGNHAEGTIAIDPSNASRLFAASNAPGVGLFTATSTDGGITWTGQTVFQNDPAPGTGGLPAACCDPSAAFDRFGNLFLTYAHDSGEGVEVALSTDGGQTWTSAASFEGELDQPTVTTGPDSVWVTFQRNGSVAAAGAALSGPGAVGPFALHKVPGGRGANFGDVAVGSAGQVAVTYQQGRRIGVNIDPDGLGPAPFGRRVTATTTHVGGFDRIPAQTPRGIDSEAALAFDRSAGSGFTGRLYLLYTDEDPDGSNNTDLMLRYSPDNGVTWGAPARVGSDLGLSSQFLPRMAVDETSGELAFSWYDTRQDPGPADTNGVPNDDALYYAARARPAADGVLLGADAQVSQGASNSDAADNSIDLGDYTGLAFLGGTVYPLWADNSNSTGDNPDGRLHALDQYTARVRADSLPEPTTLALGGLNGSAQPALVPSRGGGTKPLGGRPDYRFKVNYFSPAGVDAASIDGSDVLVTGPAGFSATALVQSSRVGKGGVRTVTYSVAAPSGRWTAGNNGTYTLAVQAGQVLDAAGAALPGGVIGSFVVRTGLS
jgi:hypothetical protein